MKRNYYISAKAYIHAEHIGILKERCSTTYENEDSLDGKIIKTPFLAKQSVN